MTSPDELKNVHHAPPFMFHSSRISRAAAVYTFTMIALAHSKIRMFAGGLESIFPLVACSVIAAFLSAALVMWGML